LVSIPVELVSIVRPGRVSFHLIHKKDNNLLQRRMFCPRHNTFVHGEHIVNGYVTGKDSYVIVRENEYKALEPKASQSIDISSFVDYEDIDTIYFDRPYYLLPRKGGAKSYELLTAVMKDTGKAGIARFVLHTREHLVVVRAGDKLLELITLHFKDQIKPIDEILPKGTAEAAKVKMIIKEINKLSGDYKPQKYIDEHHRHILEFLKEKASKGQTVTIQEPQEQEEQEAIENETDLVSSLEESLAKVKSR
jgi:DNA end-binding protein Ku